MAQVFRKTFTVPVPEGAEKVTIKVRVRGKGRQVPGVRFRHQGKLVSAPLTAKGDRCRLESPNWYGWVGGKAKKLCGNKLAAETMLAGLIRDRERGAAGLVDPFEAQRLRPIGEHLEDFRRALSGKGNSPRHVRLTCSRLENLFAGCGFERLDDLDVGRATDWLASQREDATDAPEIPAGRDSFTPKEAGAILGISSASVGTAVRRFRLDATGSGKARRLPRSTVEALLARRGRGIGAQTTNHYLAGLRAFGRWLVTPGRRLPANPLAGLEMLNVQADRRHDRRELSADELRRLLAATRASTRTFRGLDGEARYHLYALACGTGFRASALASLTPASFDFGEPPTVVLSARRNKSRKLKVQPLPPDLAALMQPYLAGKPPSDPVWPGTWAEEGRAADMIRIDLEAASIPYEVPGHDGPLFVDFHAMRHTFLTLAGRSGIDLRTLQELAGHSTPTLTARYTHVRLHDLAGAVQKLPSVLPTDQRRATGTDGHTTT